MEWKRYHKPSWSSFSASCLGLWSVLLCVCFIILSLPSPWWRRMLYRSQVYIITIEVSTLQNSKVINSLIAWFKIHSGPMYLAAPVYPCWQMRWIQGVVGLFFKEDGFYKFHRYLKSCLQQLCFLLLYFLVTLPSKKILSMYRTMYEGQQARKEYPFLKCTPQPSEFTLVLEKYYKRPMDMHSIQVNQSKVCKYILNISQTWASLVAQLVKNPSTMQETPV